MDGLCVTEEDKLRKLAEFRTLLEKRLKEIETEMEGLRVLLDFVSASLVEKGFKRAEMAKPARILPEEKVMPSIQPTAEPEEVQPLVPESQQAVPIKTATGEILANLYTDKDSMRVVVAEDKRFTVDIPPFMAFLVERVLAKMQEKDREAAESGEIAPDKILSYSIIRDGDLLQELTIRNIGPDRARELKSTIRWTLEKMHEKMKTSA